MIMKKIKNIVNYCLALLILFSCNDNENFDYLDNVTAPSNVSALFQITQDNTGLVTITPNAENAVSYIIKFGDGTSEEVTVKQGESTTRVYAEGTYSVVIEATGITGLKTEVIKELPVYFRAPENLVVKAEIDSSNPFVLNVSATADFAASFLVYFDTSNTAEEPTILGLEDTVSFEYPSVGDYTIKVVALSGGTEVTEFTEVITIEKPTQLPIDFEIFDATVFQGFGGASNQVIDNPDTNGNSSSKVGKIVKGGPEDWAGNVITLSAPIDFSSKKFITMKVWSPRAGGKVLLKLENLTEASTNMEVVATTVGNSTWEEVRFDFSTIDTSKSYQKLVLFFDIGTVGTGNANWTFYIDDIKQTTAPVSTGTPLLYDNFDGISNITTWVGDGGTGLNTAFANPRVNANNFSKNVLQYNDSGQQYANVQFLAGSKFDLSAGKSVFVLKIYVPSSSITGSQTNQVSLKLQNSALGGNSWQTQTEIVKPIVLDKWQEISFDFANDNWKNLNNNGVDPDPVNRTDLDKVVIQVNSENNTDKVIAYIDDFKYGTAPAADTAPFARDGFEGFGTITNWAGDGAGMNKDFANPFIDANNNSSKVLEYKDDGGQYANVQFVVTPKFNLVAKSKFTLQIYVPSSSITGTQPNQVSLKLQNTALGGNSWQTQTEIVKPIVLDKWQTITFDFVNDNWKNLNNNGVDPDPIDRVDLDKVVIQVNSENNTDKVTAYIDNFNYHN